MTARGDARASFHKFLVVAATLLAALLLSWPTAAADLRPELSPKRPAQAAGEAPWTPPLPTRKPESPATAEAPALAPEDGPRLVEVSGVPWDRVPRPPPLPEARRPGPPAPVAAPPGLEIVPERPLPDAAEAEAVPRTIPPPPDLGEASSPPAPPEGTAAERPAPAAPAETPDLADAPPEEPEILVERPPQPGAPAPEIVVPPPRATEAEAETFRITFEGTDVSHSADQGAVLETVVERLRDDPALRLQLLSYAGGSPEAASMARTLALDRALAVREYLIDQDVRRTRIDVRALGDTAEDGPPDRIDLVLVP